MRPSTSFGWYVLSIIVLESGGAVQSPPPPMLSTPSPAPAPSRSRTMRAIAALALASFASQALVRAADTLLPQIASDFAIPVGSASIVITAYALTHGSMQFITGPIADRFGKYRTVAIACAGSAGTVALCGLASSLNSLTPARTAARRHLGLLMRGAQVFLIAGGNRGHPRRGSDVRACRKSDHACR